MFEKFSRVSRIFGHYLKAHHLAKRFKTREELEIWQQERLRLFFKHTLSQSPYYKKYSFENFCDIPIITKNEMLDHFSAINTAGIKKAEAMEVASQGEVSRNFQLKINGYTVGLSSGTSGKRGIFLASAAEQERWAGVMLAKALGRRLWKSHKVALFLRSNSNLYESLAAGRHIVFQYFDITHSLEEHLSGLNAFQPDILTAPASILRYLAKMQEIRKISIQPRIIFSAAEVLEAEDKKYIERIFDLKVKQIYQCSEGFLGITASDGNFLLNEEYVFIEKEYIDKSTNRFIPVITDFTRTTQPIVRYRLDDVLVEDNDYTGPYTALKSIEGRLDDVFYFTSYQEQLTPIYSDVLRQVMLASNIEYQDYQLIQETRDSLILKISPLPSEADQKIFSQLFLILCQKYRCKPITVSVLPYDLMPGAHKLRRIVRLWNVEKEKSV